MNSRRRLFTWITILAAVSAGVIFTSSLVAGGRTMDLVLTYTGTRIAAQVTASQSTAGDDDTVIFDGVVQPGQVFALRGILCDDTPGSVVSLRVDGELSASMPVDCDQELEPVARGDFVVETPSHSRWKKGGKDSDKDKDSDHNSDHDSGHDSDHNSDHDSDHNSDHGNKGCHKCKDGVTELTLRYNGDDEALVEVTQKVKGKVRTIFEDLVQPGEEFTFRGKDKHRSLGSSISIFVDGELAERIHTSCSEPIGPGLVAGDFEVVAGSSHKGGELCPLPRDQEGCNECDGQVTQLTLRYNGDEEVFVQVAQKIGSRREFVFEDFVEPGEPFSFAGINRNGTLGSSIEIFVDDELAERIHTSCSEPIGPGLVAGDFEVIDGSSRRGGRLCELPDVDQPCHECEDPVTELTLAYHGEDEAFIQVIQKADGMELVAFEDFVGPDQPFTVAGADQEGTLASSVDIVVDDELAATIDTDCSESLGPGLVAGDFEVIEGFSGADVARLCPLPDSGGDCGECEGQVTELTLVYNGDSEAFVQVTQRVGSKDKVVFEDFLEPGDQFSFGGANRNKTLGSMIKISVDDELAARIHTSCSKAIGPGLVAGDFEVVQGTSRNGGSLCPLP